MREVIGSGRCTPRTAKLRTTQTARNTPPRLTWEAKYALVVLGGLLAALADPISHEFFAAVVWAGQVTGLSA